MTPAELLLSRLDKVRSKPAGKYRAQWDACCPAHPDKNPSLGIAEADDGRILVNCLAGCPIDDVVTAIGLELKDLYPKPDNYRPFWQDKFPHRKKDPTPEEMFVALGDAHIRAGVRLSEAEKAKLVQAKLRQAMQAKRAQA